MDAAEGISDALENALLPCLALLTYFPLSPSLDSNDRPVRLLSFLPPAIPRIPESQSFERRKERKEWRERER